MEKLQLTPQPSDEYSFDLKWYWGNISREEEVFILSQQADGAFLLRDCLSEPNSRTLAVRCGDRICRYRLSDAEVMSMDGYAECCDVAGQPVKLGSPVERPQCHTLPLTHTKSLDLQVH
ncbi:uncharacterized protein LOC135822342 [Sycon ciliatum]|uniref:uncharacterized protein LOC135822342 n=1 Tax=Sycon ciliatum TaxID=27933 RepID=UPI0020A8E42A|eukprot:scpid94211/ scgid0376/ 